MNSQITTFDALILGLMIGLLIGFTLELIIASGKEK